MSTTCSAINTKNRNPLSVHSTFRDYQGEQLRPHGLQWDMSGDSRVSYALLSSEEANNINTEDAVVHRWIVDAHNKWCFAKDLPFRKVEDIAKVSWKQQNTNTQSYHLQVDWRPNVDADTGTRYTIQQVDGLLKMDKSATGVKPPSEVWINGIFVAMLQPDTLLFLLETLSQVPSRKLTFRKSRGMIRIERRFVGRIVGQDIFEHLLDNLYAMEDPEVIDDLTLIGTATLPDWIMGGDLTSRIWLKEKENGNILCLRPLYDDNIDTSDRKYELKRGKDDQRIAMVREELERLRYLASLPPPFSEEDKVGSGVGEEKKETSSRDVFRSRRPRRMFGM